MGSYEQRFWGGGGGVRLIAIEKHMTVHLLVFSKYSVKKVFQVITMEKKKKKKLAPPQDSVKVICERNLYARFSKSSQIYTNPVAFHSR